MKYQDIPCIKFWDDEIVQGHVRAEILLVFDYLKENNLDSVNYVDIGANVGKYYDLFIEAGYKIKNAIMVEPSHDLYFYMLEKFQDVPNCQIYNLALSNRNGITKIESIIERFEGREYGDRTVNLGLSKISNEEGKEIELMSAYDFFVKNVEPHKNDLNFIKIDTENQDYFILESLTNYLKEMVNKPFIVMEHNYHNDMTPEAAKSIYDNFLNTCNYEGLNFEDLGSAIYLKPKK